MGKHDKQEDHPANDDLHDEMTKTYGDKNQRILSLTIKVSVTAVVAPRWIVFQF